MSTSCRTYAVAVVLFFAPLTVSAQGAQIKKQSPVIGKKLEGDKVTLPMVMVNKILKANGLATARMVYAQITAREIIDSIDAYNVSRSEGKKPNGITITRKVSGKTEATCKGEEEFVKESINSIIEPVEVFIGALKKQEKELRPIIEKSLGQGRAPRLIKYFQQTGNFKEVVQKDITTVDDLRNVCEDLETLFADIYESLTPEARQAYENIKAKMAERTKEK